MTKLCICKICTCGRHKCPHNPTGLPKTTEPCTFSEYSNQYMPHPLEATRSYKPEVKVHTNSGPMDDMTTHKVDYVQHALAEKIQPQKEKYLPPEGNMDLMTNYSKEYTEKPFEPSKPSRPPVYRKTAGKFEGEPTYAADYREWEMQPKERAKGEPNLYRPPDQPFDASTNYQNEFLPKRVEPRKNMKPMESNVLPDQPFDGDTHYKQDYIQHPLAIREVKDKPTWKPNDAPLDDLSHYKKDFTHKAADRANNFKPESSPYKSEAPFDGDTTQKTDYVPWAVERRDQPREREVYKKPDGDFDHLTTTQLDYIPKAFEKQVYRKPIEAIKPTGRFDDTTNYKSEYLQWKPSSASRPVQRPKEEYVPNEAPFDGLPTYQSDYQRHNGALAARSLKPAISEYTLDKGPMEDWTEYKKEFYKKEAPLCPAALLAVGKHAPYKFMHSDDDGHKWFEMPNFSRGQLGLSGKSGSATYIVGAR